MKKQIEYYKIKNKIIFNDGFELSPGTVVMFNFEDGELFNLQYEDINSKRIFWSHKSNLKFKSSVEENWTPSKEKEYQIDLKEKWLESNQNKENGQSNTTIRRNSGPSKKTIAIRGKKSKNFKSEQAELEGKLVRKRNHRKSSTRKTIKIKINSKKTTKNTK